MTALWLLFVAVALLFGHTAIALGLLAIGLPFIALYGVIHALERRGEQQKPCWAREDGCE